MDIRRQGHFTDFIDNIIKYAVIGKMDDAAAEVGTVQDFCLQSSGKFDGRPRQGLLSRLDQHFPAVFPDGRQEQDFDLAACRHPFSIKAGGNDFGVVEYEDIASSEFIDEVIKMLVFHGTRFPVIQHEAGMIPRFCRMLGNQFFW